MFTAHEASKAIANSIASFDTEDVALSDAAGRVLRQKVLAERDQPPFDRVTMDGIALDYSSLNSGTRQFKIQGVQQAGDRVQTLNDSDHCIEIMTGAVMPKNADCVIPVERISVHDGSAEVEVDYTAKQGQFIHPQGSDHRKGTEVILKARRFLRWRSPLLLPAGSRRSA